MHAPATSSVAARTIKREADGTSGRLMDRSTGLMVVAIGVVVVVIGLLIMSGGLSWFGRLPGDMGVDRGNVKVYIPIVTMVLVSVVLSLILWLIGGLF